MSTSTPVHILYVDDEPGLADMVAQCLEREDGLLTVHTALNAAEGIEYLEEAGCQG